ncbi:MAG TPA: Ig-like domain-containing protein, partial [Polyangia bacterium]|nr:Ig-like domain-containing protein [Polyangia bacterium]
PATNTITAIPTPAIPSQPSYLLRFVALPTGQILLTGTGGADFIYTPASGPLDSWRPTIQSVSANGDGSFTLSGTQLNGLSQGSSYGDEGNAQTNFPLVRLTSGTTVWYARTYGFSTMGFATGSATVQTQFTLPAGIPAGTYQLAVVTNGIDSASVTFTVGQGQNQAPVVALTAPANNATFTAPAQIAISATASDPDGTISKVEFYQGATLVGTATAAPYAFTWANVAAGSYAITARAYDNLGLFSTSTAANVVVTPANQAPSASITSPADGAVFTAPALITIAANASDTDGTISKVEFYQGATLLGTDTTAPYSFAWTNVPAGGYALTVKAYDNLNAVTTSAVVNVVVNTATNKAPTVSITAPANNAVFTAPAQITISATASDSDGTISKVEFYQGTTLLGTDTTNPYGFAWNSVAAGSYALTAKAYDNLNAVTTSAVINVVVNSSTGTNPCAGFCTNPLVFSGPNYQSGNVGTGAVCRETKAALHAGNCSNISGRTLKVNGVNMNCSLWTLPAAHNGGYCVQVTAGTPDYTSFATW